MRRNLIAALALAALAAAGIGAATVFGSDADVRPPVTKVDVSMHRFQSPTLGRATAAKKARKPKVVYLGGDGSIDTAQTGPFIDFGLSAPRNVCPRVIDGGLKSDNFDFFQQGTYVDAASNTYHVLMGLDDNAAPTPVTIQYTTHLICLKGVR